MTILACLILLMVWALVGCGTLERRLLFYPTHHASRNSLTPWSVGGEVIGFAREVAAPQNIWLMLHGNGGQASDRLYAIPSFSPHDSIYIMEYPGYGQRKGAPSKRTIDSAARHAYTTLNRAHPTIPISVVGESIGSGPASILASCVPPPAKIVLIVPFNKLTQVAAEHYPRWLVHLLLRSKWDNGYALANYTGEVEIFAARYDEIIPPRHAEALAAQLPKARLTIISGSHNEWSYGNKVRIEATKRDDVPDL